MLGDIDPYLSPVVPQIFLATPSETVIAKISEAFKITYEQKLGGISVLSFRVPYLVNIRNSLVRNKNIDRIKDRYLLKVKFGEQIEWFTIRELNNPSTSDGDFLEVIAYSLAYELIDKTLRSYKVDSYNLSQVVSEVLTDTIWQIGYVHADFDLKFRAFDVSSKSKLDFIFEVAETFQSLVIFDTRNKKINFYKTEDIGTNKGLKISYNKYLKGLQYSKNSNEMVTRLKVYGKDGMSIQRLNPTGSAYLEDFSFFLYPFVRDENRNVISKSDWIEDDDLCHALLDYKEKVELKTGEFREFLTQKEELEQTLTTKENELQDLINQRAIIYQTEERQKALETHFYYNISYNGTGQTISTRLVKNSDENSGRKYLVMIRSSASSVIASLNSVSKTLPNSEWTVLGKVDSATHKTSVISLNSGVPTNLKIIYIQITESEYSTNANETTLLNLYCLPKKDEEIAAKNSEISGIKNSIKNVDDSISSLRMSLDPRNNFTEAQLDMRSRFIIEREFEDQNYFNDEELYEAAKVEFDKMRQPQTQLKIDIVNFLEIVEAQRDWNKLNLGDIITIKYENLNIHIQAKIIELKFDYDSANIELTIANIKEIDDENKKFWKLLYQGVSTSRTVNNRKSQWDTAPETRSAFNDFLNGNFDAVKQIINAGSNKNIEISERGIISRDPEDPDNTYLLIQNGVLAITNTNGNTWGHAITKFGVVGERIYGKIITGNKLTIGDDDGILQILGNKGTITDREGVEVMKFGLYDETDGVDKFGLQLINIKNRVTVDKDNGFKIEKNNQGNWSDVAWLDTNGLLNIRGLKIDFIEGQLTNGIEINPEDGIKIMRADGQVRTTMNATNGIKIQRLENGVWENKFYADTDGTLTVEDLIAKRIKITDMDGLLLLDAKNGVLDLNKFKTIIGSIRTENIVTNVVTADDGFINDMTVNKLNTITSMANGETKNYITIKDYSARWITGSKIAGTETQAKDSKDRFLYWTDAFQTTITVEETLYPVMSSQYNELTKLSISLEDNGQTPVIALGAGNGNGVQERAFIRKEADGIHVVYHDGFGATKEIVLSNQEVKMTNGASYLTLKNDGDVQIHAGKNLSITSVGRVDIN